MNEEGRMQNEEGGQYEFTICDCDLRAEGGFSCRHLGRFGMFNGDAIAFLEIAVGEYFANDLRSVRNDGRIEADWPWG
jgi:hypothetical protein